MRAHRLNPESDWARIVAALAHLRAERIEQAELALAPVPIDSRKYRVAQIYCLRALIHIHKGEKSEGNSTLDRARQVLRSEVADGYLDDYFRDWVVVAVLLAEAEQKLGIKEPHDYLDSDALANYRQKTVFPAGLVRELTSRADFLIVCKRWEQAADAYTELMSLPGFTWTNALAVDDSVSQRSAVTFLRSGRTDSFVTAAGAILSELPEIDDPNVIERSLKPILLGRQHLDDLPWQTIHQKLEEGLAEVEDEEALPWLRWCQAEARLASGDQGQEGLESLKSLVGDLIFVRIGARASLASWMGRRGDAVAAQRLFNLAAMECESLERLGDRARIVDIALCRIAVDRAQNDLKEISSGRHDTLIRPGGSWRFLSSADGSDPEFGTAFTAPDFDASAWDSARDQQGGFGYGDDLAGPLDPPRWRHAPCGLPAPEVSHRPALYESCPQAPARRWHHRLSQWPGSWPRQYAGGARPPHPRRNQNRGRHERTNTRLRPARRHSPPRRTRPRHLAPQQEPRQLRPTHRGHYSPRTAGGIDLKNRPGRTVWRVLSLARFSSSHWISPGTDTSGSSATERVTSLLKPFAIHNNRAGPRAPARTHSESPAKRHGHQPGECRRRRRRQPRLC